MAKHLLVKDVPSKSKMTLYTSMPEGVVAPSLYVKVDRKAVESLMVGKYAYLKDNIKTDGRAFLGRKNTLRTQIRALVQGQPVEQPKAEKPVKVEKPKTTPRKQVKQQDFELQLANARVEARETGNWDQVEMLLDRKYQIA